MDDQQNGYKKGTQVEGQNEYSFVPLFFSFTI